MHEATLAAGPEAAGADYFARTERRLAGGGVPRWRGGRAGATAARCRGRALQRQAALGAVGSLARARLSRPPRARSRDLATLRRIDDVFLRARAAAASGDEASAERRCRSSPTSTTTPASTGRTSSRSCTRRAAAPTSSTSGPGRRCSNGSAASRRARDDRRPRLLDRVPARGPAGGATRGRGCSASTWSRPGCARRTRWSPTPCCCGPTSARCRSTTRSVDAVVSANLLEHVPDDRARPRRAAARAAARRPGRDRRPRRSRDLRLLRPLPRPRAPLRARGAGRQGARSRARGARGRPPRRPALPAFWAVKQRNRRRYDHLRGDGARGPRRAGHRQARRTRGSAPWPAASSERCCAAGCGSRSGFAGSPCCGVRRSEIGDRSRRQGSAERRRPRVQRGGQHRPRLRAAARGDRAAGTRLGADLRGRPLHRPDRAAHRRAARARPARQDAALLAASRASRWRRWPGWRRPPATRSWSSTAISRTRRS